MYAPCMHYGAYNIHQVFRLCLKSNGQVATRKSSLRIVRVFDSILSPEASDTVAEKMRCAEQYWEWDLQRLASETRYDGYSAGGEGPDSERQRRKLQLTPGGL